MAEVKMTRADIEAAKAAADRLEMTVSKARGGRSAAEEMIESRQAPAVTKSLGSDSRPFSFHRFCRFLMDQSADRSVAPLETEVCDKYKKALVDSGCMIHQGGAVGWWLPNNLHDFDGQLTAKDTHARDYHYVKSVMDAARPAYDPDEAAWLQRKRYVKTQTTSQSAYDDSIGGSLVAPPIQGETIPLIRPQTAFIAAGAQQMTLPPNGRWVAPRITGAPGVLATGESQDTVSSQLLTDQVEMTAKKIAGSVILTEEGTAFTSGTLDNIAQMELGRSLGLQMDKFAFYGNGGTGIPNGITSDAYSSAIINIETAYPGCNGIGPNGNQLLPQYGDFFPALIAERSFNMDAVSGAWVMRPSPFSTAVGLRADAVAAGDQAGVLVDIIRRFSEQGPTSWRGRKVVQTTNLLNNYSKGSSGATLTDVFFGIWQYGIMGTYGAIQFMQGHNGNTFQRGQVILRATMYGDVAYQYPWAFLWFPNVLGMSNKF